MEGLHAAGRPSQGIAPFPREQARFTASRWSAAETQGRFVARDASRFTIVYQIDEALPNRKG